MVVARLAKMHSETFRRRVNANPTNARLVRHDFQAWIAHYQLGAEAEGDLALALGEALANSVEHAYADSAPGVIEVDATCVDRHLHVTVRDHGLWRSPHDDTDRGRGLMLMRQLVDTVQVDTDGRGTLVAFDYHFRTRSSLT